MFADFSDEFKFQIGRVSFHSPYRDFLVLSHTEIAPASWEITTPTQPLYRAKIKTHTYTAMLIHKIKNVPLHQ